MCVCVCVCVWVCVCVCVSVHLYSCEFISVFWMLFRRSSMRQRNFVNNIKIFNPILFHPVEEVVCILYREWRSLHKKVMYSVGHNFIYYCGSSFSDPGSVEYTFIVINSRSSLSGVLLLIQVPSVGQIDLGKKLLTFVRTKCKMRKKNLLLNNNTKNVDMNVLGMRFPNILT